jgi:bla regulator protein blaR1
MNPTYLLSYLLVSGLLWLIYKVGLENNRSFLFNRVYLLACLVFPLVIPYINLGYSYEMVKEMPVLQNIVSVTNPVSEIKETTKTQNSNYGFLLLMYLYLIVVFSMFMRFILNLAKLVRRSSRNEQIKTKGFTIVLVEDQSTPYSFLSYVFINKNDYIRNAMPEEILRHEYAHVCQKHSFDIILVEISSVLFWFNPFVFLTKKAIQLNHEFLADQYTLQKNVDVAKYQTMILNHINKPIYNQLISTFNYFTTKKRLIMMTKVQNRVSILSRKLMIIPAFLILIFVFGDTNIAQVAQNPSNEPLENLLSNNSDLISEYYRIVEKGSLDKDEFDLSKFNSVDKKRLKDIFHQMDKKQQVNLFKTGIVPSTFSIPTNGVSSADLKRWLNDNSFTIILDMKVMNKKDLANFKAENLTGHYIGWWDKSKHTTTKKKYGAWLYTKESFNTNSEIIILPKTQELWPNSK